MIILFTIGSFVGTIYESILSIFQFGSWQSRKGLIYGPFNHVYGIGFIIAIFLLKNIKRKRHLFFLASLLGGSFEYLIWYLQKVLFHSVSWNYKSNLVINGVKPFEYLYFGGTSVFHALAWGCLLFLIIIIIFPFLNCLVSKIDTILKRKISLFLLVFFVVNALITILALYRMEFRYKQTFIFKEIDLFFDLFYSNEMMDNIFPNMVKLH